MKKQNVAFKVGQKLVLQGVPKAFRKGTITEIKNGKALFSPRTLGCLPFWFYVKKAKENA